MLAAVGVLEATGEGQETGVKAWQVAGTQAGQQIVGPDTTPLLWVPAGAFMMGSRAGQGDDDEHPRHKLRITKGFWIGKCTVTNEQYARFLTAIGKTQDADGHDLLDLTVAFCGVVKVGNEYKTKPGRAKHPVVEVSWYGAKAYCDHYGLALPTEAQWEYAARGPKGRKYPWGNDWDPQKCCNHANKATGIGVTMEVGSIPAGDSWCGASDMAGNVWQWCADWYDDAYYRKSPGADPTGPATGTSRLLRGGSWDCIPFNCRSVSRSWGAPDNCNQVSGFRVARTP